MPELVLTRTESDRRLYAFDGVGTLRLAGWTSRRGTAEAGGRRWELARRGVWQRAFAATDEAGAVVGGLHGRLRRGGGLLSWSGRELELRREGLWRERYALVEAGRVLATIEGKSYGKRPVKVSVEDGEAALEPGLLLFAAFVVRSLAAEAAAAAS
jgi:hypothetical protein